MTKTLLLFVFCMTLIVNVKAQSWVYQSSGTLNDMQSVYFFDVFNGWAVGDNGIILHTTNGGQLWSPQTSGINNQLNDVLFVNDSTGWVCGNSGKLLYTTDAGVNWAIQTSGTTEHLNALCFINDTMGWIGAGGNAILYTENGGLNWGFRNSGFYPNSNDIFFTDANNGWVAGNTGYILHTSNGGTSWAFQHTGGSNLLGAHFINPLEGWIVGLGGTILHTTDGGVNWPAQSSGVTDALLSVFFLDSQNGWVTGMNGTVLFTNDGGATWEEYFLEMGFNSNLLAINFVNSSTGWIVGVEGTIIKLFDQQEICMVTVDDVFEKNMIIWEKLDNSWAEYYKVYKLNGTTYDSIGFRYYHEMSEFVDLSSEPNVVSSRYKIGVVDSAGVESVISPYHQTMNLAVSQGVPSTTMVLNWTQYEDESGNYFPEYYYILRGTAPDNLEVFDSVSSAFNLYNNLNVTQLYYYKISVGKPNSCVPTSADKAEGGPYSQSYSNLEDNAIEIGIHEVGVADNVNVYPNPFSTRAMIEFSNPYGYPFTFEMTDIAGHLVKYEENVTGSSIEVSRDDLSVGVYIFRLKGKFDYHGKMLAE